MHETRSIEIEGGTLHVEIRGAGSAIVLTGSPMGASSFVGLADELATDHLVITHDPRGIAESRLDDQESDSTPALRADDLVAVLDALGLDRATVIGSSGGAVTGIDLVTRHPERVELLIAHEPPLLELLPDAAEQRAATLAIIEAYRTGGLEAGMGAFMANAGFDGDDAQGAPAAGDGHGGGADSGGADSDGAVGAVPSGAEESGGFSAQDRADAERFLGHELLGTATYVPDAERLREVRDRIVVGIGAESDDLLTSATSKALATLLDVDMTEFPGAHVGFIGDPAGFAAVVRGLL